ncbi:hypothetical protein HK097_009394 [Rhizophlyctis rosea]|uniref:Uncharacterized protein n=1 Tax=Rhizophlyctis rosea TaxID=64517 RepID=A0AAD5X3T9_9FUNG|nr:hypothetical protein HK097_009394 [Rhizophlyctis rosea]
MALPSTICSLQGIYYQHGTQIPVASRFGEKHILYNHTTGTHAAVDADGLVRLEGGGSYTAEVLDLDRRLGRQGRARSESNLDESKKTWKGPGTVRLGRRPSEQSLSPPKRSSNRPPSIGSLNCLRKGSIDEDESLHKIDKGFFQKSPKKSPTKEDASPITSSFPNLLDSIKSYRRQSSSGFGSTSTIRRKSQQVTPEPLKADHDVALVPSASSSSGSVTEMHMPQPQPQPQRSTSIGSLNRRLSASPAFGAPSLESIPGTLARGSSGASGTFQSEDEEHEDHQGEVSMLDFLGPSLLKKSSSLLSDSSSIPTPSNRASVMSKRSGSFVSDDGNSPKGSVGKRSYVSSRLGRFSIGVSTSQDSLAEIPKLAERLETEKDSQMVSCWFTLRDYVLRAYQDERETEPPLLEVSMDSCLSYPDPNLSPFGFEVVHESGVQRCIAHSYESMLSWLSLINTASSNISLAHTLATADARAALKDPETETYQSELTALISELTEITTSMLNDRDTGNVLPPLPRAPPVTQSGPRTSIPTSTTPPPTTHTPAPTATKPAAAKRVAALSRADSTDLSPRNSTSFLALNVSSEDLTDAEAQVYEVRDADCAGGGSGSERENSNSGSILEPTPPSEGAPGGARFHRAHLRQIVDDLGGSVVLRYEDADAGAMDKYSIAAGSIDKLVERLADEHLPDLEYITAFLFTYRFFAGSDSLLHMLQARLHVEPPQNPSPDQIAYVRKWRHLVRLRTIHVVKVWMDRLWHPDFLAATSRIALGDFISAIVKGGMYLEEDDRRLETKPRINFIDLDPKEVAVQLTLMEHDRLRAIHPVALLLQLNDKGKDPLISAQCVPVRAMIEAFNQTSYWVATEICTQPELKNRVKVVEKCVKMGKQCRKLNNFHTLMAIISGLNVSAVGRLKETWEAVDPKHRKTLDELETLLSPQHNYRSYRTLLDQTEKHSTPQPLIPILGLLLKDLLFLDDGNKTKLENGLINFSKFRTMYMNVARFASYQEVRYSSTMGQDRVSSEQVAVVSEFVRNLRCLKEAALYKYSCLCEAKVGAEETLRDKWMKESRR